MSKRLTFLERPLSSPSGPGPKRPAYEQVAADLRRQIVVGDLGPGDRLPTEAELTGLFDVSRSTVREALRSLMSQNLVETRRGVTGGTFVAIPDSEAVSDLIEANLGLLAVSRSVEVEELLETREMLEVPAARLAAERRSPDDLDAFRVWLVDPDHVGPEELFEANRGFHQAVVTASGNGLLDVVCRPIFGVLRTRFVRADAPTEFWDQVDIDHRAIADAIASADPDRAADAMREHLARLRGTYQALDRAREPQRSM